MAREKERERRGWTDGCVTSRDFYPKENINQGPRAISCFTCVCFFTFNLFHFFPKGMLLDFFCIFVSWSWKLKSAMVLTVDWLWPTWCAKPTILFIQRSYYYSCSSTLLDLAVFVIPIFSSSGYTVVMMYIILCALSYVRVFYTVFFFIIIILIVWFSPWIGQIFFLLLFSCFWHFVGI